MVSIPLSKRSYVRSLCALTIEKENLFKPWEDPWRGRKKDGNSGLTGEQMLETDSLARLMPQDRTAQSMIETLRDKQAMRSKLFS